MFRTILILGRVSNLPTVWTNVLAGWFIAGGEWTIELLWIEIGVSLLYVAGMTLNDAFDAGWDREHAPERPIPSGAISRPAVWMLGAGQMAGGLVVLFCLTNAGWPWVGGLVAAIVIYDAIHKKTPWAVAVMGACRGLVYLVAASALGGISVIPPAVILLYIAGITLSARSERDSKGRPRLFLCWAALVVGVAASFVFAGQSFDRAGAIVLCSLPILIWIFYCSQVGVTKGIGPMIGRLIAGITLFDAFFILVLGPPISALDLRSEWLQAALLCVAFLPLALLLQRRIPAT